MAKIKIHELAKEMNIPSKEIVNLLKEQGADIKNHMSNIEEKEIKLVRHHFVGKGSGASEIETGRKKEAVKQTMVEKETAAVSKSEIKSTNEEKEIKQPTQRFGGQSSGGDQRQQNITGQTHADQGGQRAQSAGQNQRTVNQGENQGSQRREPGCYQSNQRQGHQGGQQRSNQGYNQGSSSQNQRQGGYQNRQTGGGGQGQNQGGYQGQRQGGYQGQNQGGQQRQGGYQGQNPGGGQQRQGGYQGQGQGGQQRQSGYQGQNQGGQRQGGYQGQNQGGYQGQRQGGYQGQNQGGQRQGGYQGQNQSGQHQSGYQGQNQGGQRQGGYQGQNQSGQRQGGGYQGQNQGQRPGGYQGQRQGQGSQGQGGYQGQRPGGYQGQRQGQQGSQGQGGQRTGGYQGQRQGQGGQYSDRRPGNSFDKDKDSNYGNRNFSDRKTRTDSKGDKSIKSELVNELTKEQRAAAFSDKSRDRNRDKNKDRNLEDKNKAAKNVKKDPNRKGAFIMPKPQLTQEKRVDEVRSVIIPELVTIKEFSEKLKRPAAAIIKKLFLSGKMVSINSEITFEEAEELALEYNCITEKEVKVNMVEELLKEEEEDESLMKKRPPVVCVMGHVDHGKTSLLDAIRETNVTAREAGGITQHIGAYMVEINGEQITFLDTPGHEAFTSMRMRGAKSTDIAILVVAADDGVMPQTVEAINHAKAANVQIIVAVNKMDKPGANLERVKQELTEHALVAEDWGGDTIFVPVSAKTREGIENLLEMVLLTAEISDLKANPDRKARGIVIEAELDKGRGPVATILVQKGTLQVGDNVAIGAAHGKVRAMMDDKGRRVKEVYPSMPVEILGLNGVPDAGEIVISVKDEKEARAIAEAFISQGKEKLLADTKARLSLDGLFSQIKAGSIKELNLIIKADVQGSVEAVKQSLVKLSNEEVVVRAIHGGVGAINESDVNLASASNAIIIGFNVKPDNTAKEIADREKVEVKLYRVIYNAIEDVEAAMKGMLKPIFVEKVIGHAEIRQTFKASGLGVIAGSYVLDGKIVRGCSVRITREETLLYEGPLASLKRFKDDVKEVAAGYECGLTFEKFDDLQEFDRVEFYVMEEVPR